MADRPKLTDKQREIYEFIADKIRSRGYGPTVREIGGRFDIKSPNGVMCHLQALVKKGLIVREPNMSRAISLCDKNAMEPGIPLAGTIAAGLPIETYEQNERVDFSGIFNKEGHFALRVTGQSMIDDHIDDGDFVIVKRQETARDGQTVVALVDGAETTLKRFYREPGGRFRLEPRNASMTPIFSKDVQVLGVVVGVVRQMDK